MRLVVYYILQAKTCGGGEDRTTVHEILYISSRFLPSEFGCEEDRITLLPPFEAFLETKKKIRRLIEASAIPYTFVSANCFAAYFINRLLHPHDPRPDFVVYGTGEAKAVLNYEQDTARYTIKVANDLRTCNCVVSRNLFSQNELISLWEKKMVQSFEKVLMQEDEMIKLSQTLPSPDNIAVSIIHSIFVTGDLMSFDLDEDDLEPTSLYSEIDTPPLTSSSIYSSLNLLWLYPLHWNEELYLSTRLIAITACTNDGSRDFVLQIFL
ncbi:hypothetical protein NL676_003496 [Syzygium grande]|nr:hypothetical protein NL676_003496 [Syzygium grande]